MEITVKADEIQKSLEVVDVTGDQFGDFVFGRMVHPDGRATGWWTFGQDLQRAIETARWQAAAEMLAREVYSGSGSLAWSLGTPGEDYAVFFTED